MGSFTLVVLNGRRRKAQTTAIHTQSQDSAELTSLKCGTEVGILWATAEPGQQTSVTLRSKALYSEGPGANPGSTDSDSLTSPLLL